MAVGGVSLAEAFKQLRRRFLERRHEMQRGQRGGRGGVKARVAA